VSEETYPYGKRDLSNGKTDLSIWQKRPTHTWRTCRCVSFFFHFAGTALDHWALDFTCVCVCVCACVRVSVIKASQACAYRVRIVCVSCAYPTVSQTRENVLLAPPGAKQVDVSAQLAWHVTNDRVKCMPALRGCVFVYCACACVYVCVP